ncbi:MAG: imidazole glycerol phosphate synthase subunit HisF [Candidatus Handelsmanbacteria bacterium RIFCSPLOWO2_12_FULL_64_10]|uniref:Imidazole glycerol phosphate synthase subunit HisF n=1 Tax=Handelsmanbacteria sp. (strain RIFCSPLOWO2_12_FULL_64_10) TaxID=1817868 RepID=A0A1F6C2Q8_HANXR|nr:MAG: imidazole glycerol phosphate synthase subunit HisF [Candidatus Handelsmanbacteria bacterium RIFCSPLOWO2_12_FULL_64_10]
MLAKRIIPCLDVKNGRNVRGVKFSADRDAGDPVELARRYDAEGADELVFYDITASAERRQIVADLVRRVSEEVFIPFTVGGGVRDFEDIRAIIEGGAEKVSINSAAVRDPQIIARGAETFGVQAIVGSIDAIRRHAEDPAKAWWEVVIDGGRTPTGRSVLEWAEELTDRGAGELVLNSIDADGTKDGYDIPLTRAVAERVDVPIVASGGCGGPEHMCQVLQEGKASAALAASIFHYRQYSIPEVKRYLSERGLLVRTKVDLSETGR